MNKKIIILSGAILIIIVSIGTYYSSKNKPGTISKKESCNFELLDVKVSRYHKDGPDLNKIKELEEKLKTSCSYDGHGINWCEMSESSTKQDLYWEKDSKDKLTWIEVEGMIKLNGSTDQYIKNVVSKIYTNDDKKVYLGEDYVDINKTLSPGTSYPFKLTITLDRNINLVGKYFNKDDEVKIDAFPYFLSCNY